jgi:hypothetical protein
VELAREIIEAYARQAQERETEEEEPSAQEREPQQGDDGEPGDERGFYGGQARAARRQIGARSLALAPVVARTTPIACAAHPTNADSEALDRA